MRLGWGGEGWFEWAEVDVESSGGERNRQEYVKCKKNEVNSFLR